MDCSSPTVVFCTFSGKDKMFCDYLSMYIKISLDSLKSQLKTVSFVEFYDKLSPSNTQQAVVRNALL